MDRWRTDGASLATTGADVRLDAGPEPAGDSPWLKGALAAGRPNSGTVIAHIRHATQGGLSLANTQPFARELGGRMHVFAHNGMLLGVERLFGQSPPRFRPVGETDSEIAFCALLDRLAPLWRDEPATVTERHAEVRRFAQELRALGPANFLYCDGEILFAHGHRRKQADGAIAWPGLHLLTRRCAIDRDALPASGVDIASPSGPQVLTLFASVPLSDEGWKPVGEGDVVAAAAGELIAASP